MRAYQTRQVIPESHTLTVQLPPDMPVGLAEVIVLFPEYPDVSGSSASSGADVLTQDLSEFFRLLGNLPASGRTREQIDRDLQSERDAWE